MKKFRVRIYLVEENGELFDVCENAYSHVVLSHYIKRMNRLKSKNNVFCDSEYDEFFGLCQTIEILGNA